jgi:hypothetical protein
MMSEIGHGYGSEWHLLRYLGYHRTLLDQQVLESTRASRVDWLDFGFRGPKSKWRDSEIKGLDFLSPDDPIRKAWADVWPQRGNAPNWDAVGRISANDDDE